VYKAVNRTLSLMVPSTVSLEETWLHTWKQLTDFSERRTAIKELEEGEGIQQEMENKW